MSKMIEFKDTENWLGSGIRTEDLIGMITDIANGLYSWEQLAEDIKDYKEHNE